MIRASQFVQRRWMQRIVVVGGLCVVFAGVFVWMIGGQLCRAANRTVGPSPNDFPFESVTFSSRPSTTVHAWFASPPKSEATIVLVHPLRGDRRTMMGRAKLLWEHGFSLLLIDLQAHGETLGDTITFGHLEQHDVVAAARWAKKRNPNHPIGLIGWSLGGAAAVLASPQEIDAMVLESVYPTINEAVANRLKIHLGTVGGYLSPLLLCQLGPRLGITTSELRPVESIGQVGCPTLILAGDKDVHTTIGESQELFRRAREPKRIVVFDGAPHVDLLAFDRDKYEKEVLAFFAEHLSLNIEL